MKIGPSASDLRNRYEYHLDFPGDALNAGCDYERWSRRLAAGSEPTVYAHVATEAGHPGQLALQYWIFYAFNDFNNTHEGDWEMIQLVFDADDAQEALGQEPVAVGYSSHEGAERADWGDEKLDVVDETHPVVYPAAGLARDAIRRDVGKALDLRSNLTTIEQEMLMRALKRGYRVSEIAVATEVRAPLGHVQGGRLEIVVGVSVAGSGAISSDAGGELPMTALSRKRALLLLSFITAAGAAVQFYGLGWGAPDHHFHIDEHFVFAGALAIRDDFFEAANSAKFFERIPRCRWTS